MIRARRKWTVAFVLIVMGVAAAYGVIYWQSFITVGDLRINPRAPVNKQKEYTITVWDRTPPLPWAPRRYEDVLQEAADRITNQYPHITVEIQTRPWDDGGQDGLLKALTEGKAPDIYGTWGESPRIDRRYQVPVESYLTSQDQTDLLERSTWGLSADGHLWAWPRWLWAAHWIGHKQLLEDAGFDMTKLYDSGWTWSEFTEAAAKVGLAVNAYDPSFATQTLSAHAPLVTEKGELGWTRKQLEAFATLVKNLKDRGGVKGSIEIMSRTRLRRFAEGSVGIVAPLNPWSSHHLVTAAGNKDELQPAVLPIPHFAPSEADPGFISSFIVFRQNPYRGDDHTRAAMVVARELSREIGRWTAAQLGAIPAFRSEWDEWRQTTSLDQQNQETMISLASRIQRPSFSPPGHDTRHRLARDVIAPILTDLWAGRINPDRFAEVVYPALEEALKESPATPTSAPADIARQP